MTIQQAQYVLEIAKCGSISKAAGALFISQPALSAQVKALEQELGCQLFQRSARGVQPTEAGRTFCRCAEPAVRAWLSLVNLSAELKDGAAETIRIGFDVRAQSNGLARPVLDYFDLHPNTNLSFITDMHQSALEALTENRMDLAICRLPPEPVTPAKERFHIVPLLTERQCILMSREAAGTCPEELPFRYLDGRTVVCGPRGSIDDVEMKKVSEMYSFKVSRVLRSDDISTVMAMVRNGRGFALGPASMAERFDVAAVPLVPETQIALNLICRKEDRQRELIVRLTQLLQDAAGQLLRERGA